MLRNLVRRVALFATEVQKSNTSSSSGSTITQYREGQLVNRTSITLKKQQDIEAYVVKTVQNYFRTTYKNGKPIYTQASAKTAHYQNMGSTRLTQLKSPCKSKKTSDTQSQLKPYLPSLKSNISSPTSNTLKPSKKKITKHPSDDQST